MPKNQKKLLMRLRRLPLGAAALIAASANVLTFAEAFTVAADDARTVIDYLHTYPVPDTN